MKINPPKAIIDEKDPFANALFGRKDFAESLTNLLRNVDENLVIFVNAPWGEGKTTFAQMWRLYLQQQKLETIYYDAYAADYFDDPFISFSGEILCLVDKRLSEGKGLLERSEFKETAVEIGKRLLGLAAKIGIRAATLGALESSHLKELKEIGSEVAFGVSEIGADVIKQKIENYGVEKDALVKFKKSLAQLATIVRKELGFPLTIIVDELDRCRPDFALGLLERIKHLFEVPGVSFVLLVNREQIESYIRLVYGDVDAKGYLLKFGNLFIDLPGQRQSENGFVYVKGHADHCQVLVQHYGITSRIQDGRSLASSVTVFADHFALTLREIERVFSVLAIYYSALPGNEFTNDFLVAFLSVLKIKQPLIFRILSHGLTSSAEIYQQTGLDKLNTRRLQNLAQEWARDMLDYCLMSDSEFAAATTPSGTALPKRVGLIQMATHIRMARQNVIPFLCKRINQFSFQPQ